MTLAISFHQHCTQPTLIFLYKQELEFDLIVFAIFRSSVSMLCTKIFTLNDHHEAGL